MKKVFCCGSKFLPSSPPPIFKCGWTLWIIRIMCGCVFFFLYMSWKNGLTLLPNTTWCSWKLIKKLEWKSKIVKVWLTYEGTNHSLGISFVTTQQHTRHSHKECLSTTVLGPITVRVWSLRKTASQEKEWGSAGGNLCVPFWPGFFKARATWLALASWLLNLPVVNLSLHNKVGIITQN